MRAAEDASRDPFRVLECLDGLAEIVERGAGAQAEAEAAERLRIKPPHPEREFMTISENASRHGHHFEQQRLGFCVVP